MTATAGRIAASSNAGGAAFGEVASFTTAPEAPNVATLRVEIADEGVRLRGTADPKGSETEAWFRVGTEDPRDCNDSFGTRVPETGGLVVGDVRGDAPFDALLHELAPGAYYLCALAGNDGGIGLGEVEAFQIQGAGQAHDPPPGGEEGGCGCATGPGGPGVGWAVAALVVLARRRSRAR